MVVALTEVMAVVIVVVVVEVEEYFVYVVVVEFVVVVEEQVSNFVAIYPWVIALMDQHIDLQIDIQDQDKIVALLMIVLYPPYLLGQEPLE